MSVNIHAEEALRIAGNFNVQDFYPAPFPEDVESITLERISLGKLLNGDEIEAARVFSICTTVGFFYLDLLDHVVGRQIWRSACKIRQLGQERLSNTSMEEKLQYKPLDGVRVFDRGCVVSIDHTWGLS